MRLLDQPFFFQNDFSFIARFLISFSSEGLVQYLLACLFECSQFISSQEESTLSEWIFILSI